MPTLWAPISRFAKWIYSAWWALEMKMWIILRHAFTRPPLWSTRQTSRFVPVRTYASKSKNKPNRSQPDEAVKGSRANPTSNLIPKSQRILTNDIAQAEYDKASTKMSTAVDWFKKEVAGLEARGIGRVTPTILDPVRVALPDAGKDVRLEEVATVGVREGTNLIITLFEEEVRSMVGFFSIFTIIPSIEHKAR